MKVKLLKHGCRSVLPSKYTLPTNFSQLFLWANLDTPPIGWKETVDGNSPKFQRTEIFIELGSSGKYRLQDKAGLSNKITGLFLDEP